MSKPAKYSTTTWRPDRLAEAMRKRKFVTPDGELDTAKLRDIIIRNRVARGDERTTLELRTIRTWLEPGTDGAINGRTGSLPAVYEIADALQLSLDWLTGRVAYNIRLTPAEVEAVMLGRKPQV